MKKVAIGVKITKERIDGDPPTDLYAIEMTNGHGVWRERLVKRDLDLFFHGLRAGAGMAGASVKPFEIP